MFEFNNLCSKNEKYQSLSGGLFLIVILILLGVQISPAQSMGLNLKGRVLDPLGKGIPGATIKVLESSLSVMSDSVGEFSLEGTLLGIFKQARLQNGLQVQFAQGNLVISKFKGSYCRLEWISSIGKRRSVFLDRSQASNGVIRFDLNQWAAASSGSHWLRLVTENGCETFRFVRSGEGSGILLGTSKNPNTPARFFKKAVGDNSINAFILVVSAPGFIEKRFYQNEAVKAGLSLTLLPTSASLQERIQDFIGTNQNLRIAFLKKESSTSRKYALNYVDFSEMKNDSMPIHLFPNPNVPGSSPYGAFAPSWSPDGRSIAYETGWENLTNSFSRIYIQPLNGNRLEGPIYPSTNPRWWTDGKDTSLIWCTTGAQSGWTDTMSITVRQNIRANALVGSMELLTKGSYNGGLSRDGRFLATSYPYGVMLDRQENSKRFFHIYPNHPKAKDGTSTDSMQVCNASISADPLHPNRMMFLDFGVPDEPTYANIVTPKIYAQHRMILIGEYSSDAPGRIVDYIDTPLAELAKDKTWDDPEWTNHADYAVATTRDPYGDKTNPSEPLPTQPDIYLIKISTKETLKILSGINQILPVAWIGQKN